MKVEEKEEVFTPIVITLESQVEVDALVDLLHIGSRGVAAGSNEGVDVVTEMVVKLSQYSSDVDAFIYYKAPSGFVLEAK